MASPTSKNCFILNEARYVNVWGYVRESSIPRCGHLTDTANASHSVTNLQPTPCQEHHESYSKWQNEMNFQIKVGYLPVIGAMGALSHFSEACCPLQEDIKRSKSYKVAICSRGISQLFCLGSLCCPIDIACCCYREKCSHNPTGGMLIKQQASILKTQSPKQQKNGQSAKKGNTPKSQNYVAAKPNSPSANRK